MSFLWNLNLALGKAFEIVLSPFAGLNPIWGLTVISVFTGAVMVFIFKYISNQKGIRIAKAKVRGYFLEVWIYKHEFRNVFGSIGRILKANFIYMRYAVAPLIVMIIPVVLIMVHLNLFYGFRGFKPGETILVTVKWNNSAVLRDTTLTAQADSGLNVETKPTRSLGKNEATWRLNGASAGRHTLTVSWKGGEVTKDILIGTDRVQKISPKKSLVSSFSEALLNPGEKPLSGENGVVGISVNYPEVEMNFLGFEMHWIIIFFILSIVAGFALKGVFGVEI